MKLRSWLFVPKCAVCGERLERDTPVPLCRVCQLAWEREKVSDCPVCGQPPPLCWCGVRADSGRNITREVHLAYYTARKDSCAKHMILGMKRRINNSVADMLASELAEKIKRELPLENAVIVNIPRSKKSVRLYGHDQTLILAQKTADLLGTEVARALEHRGATAQKMLGLRARIENAKKSYTLPRENRELVRGRTVILIDDVITTGATAARCAQLLRRAGADEVYAVSLAKSY